jgi:DNA-binding XRE family transcriptional regulator
MYVDTGMAAARRVPLERPPTAADEAKVVRQQHLLRVLLGRNIKKFREEVGLSQRALAMRADLSTNHIGRCEKGRHAVTTDFLVRVSYHLGTTPIALLSG